MGSFTGAMFGVDAQEEQVQAEAPLVSQEDL
jgi:hypothetical protein